MLCIVFTRCEARLPEIYRNRDRAMNEATHRVKDAEDCGVGADTQSQGQNRNYGEARMLGQLANAVTDIVHEVTIYSARRVIIGLTCVARWAAHQQAIRATNASSADTPPKVEISVAL